MLLIVTKLSNTLLHMQTKVIEMINKTIFSLLLLMAFQASYAEDVWVAVSVYDGRNNGINEYNGLLDSEMLGLLTKEADEHAMFKLSEAFWLNDEGVAVRMSNTRKYGRKHGYTDTIYFKQKAIVRLIVLDDSFVRSVLK